MISNILYWTAVFCIGAVCVRQYRIRFVFGRKFERLKEREGVPPMRYAELWLRFPGIAITQSNFDRPVWFFLAVNGENANRREILKLLYLSESLKAQGAAYECVVSAEPDETLRAAACLVFDRNKYRFGKFPTAEGKIYWKYPRFPAISGNSELCEAYRRVRRCILNYYHRNKYKDDPFFVLLFEFFQADRETFLRLFRRELGNAFDTLNRECAGVLAPYSEDEQGLFFAISLYYLSVYHIDLEEESGLCVSEVRRGKFPVLRARREEKLSSVFFPLLENYLARAQESDLKSFNYLCSYPFREKFDREAVAFRKKIEDENLSFLLRFSALPAAEGIGEFCARARRLRHNLPEDGDFFSACALWLVFVSKILKLNVAGERVYFGTPKEALPLEVELFGKRVTFEPSSDACLNNSFSLRSDKGAFTIYVGG